MYPINQFNKLRMVLKESCDPDLVDKTVDLIDKHPEVDFGNFAIIKAFDFEKLTLEQIEKIIVSQVSYWDGKEVRRTLKMLDSLEESIGVYFLQLYICSLKGFNMYAEAIIGKAHKAFPENDIFKAYKLHVIDGDDRGALEIVERQEGEAALLLKPLRRKIKLLLKRKNKHVTIVGFSIDFRL